MDGDDDFFDACMDTADDYEEDDIGAEIGRYNVLDPDDVAKTLNEYIEDTITVFSMPATIARILLAHVKWDKQKLMEKLCDEDNRSSFFEAAHIVDPFEKKTTKRIHWNSKFECAICYTKLPMKSMLAADCGHKFCKDCWKQYLTFKIRDEGVAEAISCPESDCEIIVDDVAVLKLVEDKDVRDKYQHLMTDSFVEHNKTMRWCPGAGCLHAIKAENTTSKPLVCVCKCGHQFCFDCGGNSHQPVHCNLLRKWRLNNEETLDWLIKTTKPCPKCSTPIEKNGGCNHMTCRKCNHEFCWLCFKDWKNHGGDGLYCNRYTNEKGQAWAVNKPNEKFKFHHYYARYAAHRSSLKAEEKLKESAQHSQKKMMDELNMGWVDVQFTMRAVEVLCECRQALMYSYVFAYYVKESLHKTIFEDNQSDLEQSVERLSRYLELEIEAESIKDIEQKLKDKAKYCDQRKEVLENYIEEGYGHDWWSFDLI